MLGLMAVLAKNGSLNPALVPKNPKEVAAILSCKAPRGSRMNLAIEDFGYHMPFSKHLAALLMFSTSLVVPGNSNGISVKMFKSEPVDKASNEKSELLVYVSGLELAQGARAFDPYLKDIACSMGGTALMNGSSISFKFDMPTSKEYTGKLLMGKILG